MSFSSQSHHNKILPYCRECRSPPLSPSLILFLISSNTNSGVLQFLFFLPLLLLLTVAVAAAAIAATAAAKQNGRPKRRKRKTFTSPKRGKKTGLVSLVNLLVSVTHYYHHPVYWLLTAAMEENVFMLTIMLWLAHSIFSLAPFLS